MATNCGETIAAFEGLVSKPTLKEKLLNKPPFRFLHDIVTNLQKATSFPPEGCFKKDQLHSANVKEKDQKIDFLKRVIQATEMAMGATIDVRPLKIVAGLEPENTNILLQQLAEAAKNASTLNLPKIAARVSRQEPSADAGEGETAGEPKMIPDDDAPRERESDEKSEVLSVVATAGQEEAETLGTETTDEAAVDKPPERRRRLSSNGGLSQPAARDNSRPSSAAGLPVTRATIVLPSAPHGETVFDATIRMLGSVIQRPKLSPKLLGKPPFRFIHDIVTNCMKATGCPEGLFEGQELDSKSITEPKDKLSFLKKLINFVAVAVNDPSLADKVNPKKIAAGLEAENTNLLLQSLATACASGVDSSAVLEKLNSKNEGEGKSSPSTIKTSTPKAGKNTGPTKALAMPKLALDDLKDKNEDTNPFAAIANSATGGVTHDDSDTGSVVPPQKLGRPRTARKAPPKLKDNTVSETKERAMDGASLASGVILDGAEEPDEPDEEEEVDEPLVGFNDAPEYGIEANGQHGKLVSDILKAQGKGKNKEEEKDPKFGFARLPSARKAQNNSLYNSKNMNELRQKIQKICQSANPLGKIIDFVYEDMDTMNKELVKWRSLHQKYTEEFEDAKNMTDKGLAPLSAELNKITTEITDQTKRVHRLKALIFKNDKQLQGLLEQHSGGDF